VRWELVEPVSDGVHMRTTIEGLLGLSRTVLAADGGKVEDVELAALRDTASTESRATEAPAARARRAVVNCMMIAVCRWLAG
jgi:hypothetical protein